MKWHTMSRKALKVTVELDIHAVTCPGVWLCQNGKITLRTCTMNYVAETEKLSPVFPLLYHEKFIFKKCFPNVRYLSDLQQHLAKECLYAELTQWPETDKGIMLARFEASLVDILFPKSLERADIIGVDVDLLMESSRSFPGILAPKIEVSTKVAIVEVVKSSNTNKGNTNVTNPKMLSSKCTGIPASKHRIRVFRQRKVCHSRSYSKVCHTLRGRACHNPSKHNLRTPFVVRHVKDDIFENDSPQRVHARPNDNKCKHRTLDASPCQPLIWQSGSGRVYSPRTCCQILNNADSEFPNTGCKEKRYVCGSHTHLSGSCTVCSQYKDFFNKNSIKYDPKLPYKNESYQNNIGECSETSSESCRSQDYITNDSSKLVGDISQRVDEILDSSHHYPFLEDKEIHSSSTDPYALLSHNGNQNQWNPHINSVSYRQEFYQSLEKFYRKLYKRAKARNALETKVC